MATYEIKYQFSLSDIPVPNDENLEIDEAYDRECLGEVQISENVEPQCLNAARLDFIDDFGMLAPFYLKSFRIVSYIKKN